MGLFSNIYKVIALNYVVLAIGYLVLAYLVRAPIVMLLVVAGAVTLSSYAFVKEHKRYMTKSEAWII